MKKLNELTYGIVGLGLMGGSIAKAIREYVLSKHGSTGRILSSSRNLSSLKMAKDQNVIDEF